MILLDVIDLGKIYTVNCKWEKKMLSHGRKRARLWSGSYAKMV